MVEIMVGIVLWWAGDVALFFSWFLSATRELP